MGYIRNRRAYDKAIGDLGGGAVVAGPLPPPKPATCPVCSECGRPANEYDAAWWTDILGGWVHEHSDGSVYPVIYPAGYHERERQCSERREQLLAEWAGR